MADRVYLMRADDLTPAMMLKADNIEDAKCVTVLSADVSSFESGLPANQKRWMSSDKADANNVEGFQIDGVTLPEEIIRG